MTPNLGQGANSAIESAAALANTLHDMINTHNIQQPSDKEIDTYLELFTESRRERTTSIAKTSGVVTRMHARDGLINKLIGRYYVPYAKDFPADMCSNVMLGATKLDFIPVSKRSEKGWMSVHPQVGAGRGPLLKQHVLKVSVCVFFLLAAFCYQGVCAW